MRLFAHIDVAEILSSLTDMAEIPKIGSRSMSTVGKNCTSLLKSMKNERDAFSK